ncbi:MAG: nitroreductase family protein [Candidatus Omnitrophica bacterium]|nr:nitroreductase family protein [Candidatus Omnitrophota bacterium]
METVDAISRRASVREYSGEYIDKDILKRLVDCGRMAPTARAVEPWEIVVITERGILKRLGEIATSGSFIKNAAACIVIYCQDTKYYLEDGCAATENILIAASDAGLGSCWVAGDKKPYAPDVSRLLGVPTNYKLVSMISLGWPKEETRQVKKRTVDDVIHWEHFRQKGIK